MTDMVPFYDGKTIIFSDKHESLFMMIHWQVI